MKVSWNWLAELVPGLAERAVGEIAEALTLVGLEVESVEERGRELSGVVVAEVLGARPHPNADKLRIVRVRAGSREEDVVCGAPNVPAPGFRVCWAQPGATLPGGKRLDAREVRGVLSPGMLCSEPELGIGERGEGILVLPPSEPSGEDFVRRFGVADHVLEVNVTPNRPDALSHLGVARELAGAFGTPLVRPSIPDAMGDASPAIGVEIADAAACPRYQARFATGLTVAPSPLAVQLRLAACGVRAISNLVDVTNYVLLELGQPLHAFDLDRVEGGITVRTAREGEGMVTLDGVERRLLAGDVVIADARGAIALAGVMGGAATEVTAQTRQVLLEAATFDPRAIRRTSKRLGLSSESSYRFERGVDPNGVPYAAARALALLAAWGGGVAHRALVDRYPRPVSPRSVRLPVARLRQVSGVPYDVGPARAALSRIAEAVELEGAGDEAVLVAQVPTYRPDLTIAEDLIEEILRVDGRYVAPARPELVLPNSAPKASPEAVHDRARSLLAGAGFSEAATWGFVPRAGLVAIAGEPPVRELAEGFVVRNPISADYEVMRSSLLPGLAAALRRNLSRGVPDVALFEVGPIIRRGPEGQPVQRTHAAGVVAGRSAGWLKPGEPVDFFDVKRVIEDLLGAMAGSSMVDGERGQFVTCRSVPFLHPGVSADVIVDGARVGSVGELHPLVARKLDLEGRVHYFELDLDGLPGAPVVARTAAPPRFPAAVRDVSFWIEVGVTAADQRAAFAGSGEPLLRELAILEDFRDTRYAPAGKKGMLWSMTYRADERTLTDGEVDAAHARVVDALRGRFPIQIR
jgi:phenylalanyl-tRNA synthetase beta chain